MATLGQGIVLMVAGMGIVFAFLYILILVSKWASEFVSRFDYLIPDDKPKKAIAKRSVASDERSVAPVRNDGMSVTAPVPGTVLRLTATNGQKVAKGEELLVLDVMKMETPITAPCAGRVSICISVMDKVATGDTLAIIG